MSAEIYLVCNDGRSNKFYHIEVDRPSVLTPGVITKNYGRVGDNLKNERGGKVKFTDQESTLRRNNIACFIESKLKKGYEIREFRSPISPPGASSGDLKALSRMSGMIGISTQSSFAAIYLFDEGRSFRGGETQSQPVPKKIKPPKVKDVQVTFDPGQTCPVW